LLRLLLHGVGELLRGLREFAGLLLGAHLGLHLLHLLHQGSQLLGGGQQATVLAAIDEEVVRCTVGPPAAGKAHVFEDQYASTGGQLYGLMAGHDRFIADLVARAGTPAVLVANKTDRATPATIAERLASAAELGDFAAFVPLSARTGDGVDALLDELVARLPEGPHYYPDGMVSDQPESFLAAELVREKLLAVARDELPHSIAVTTEAVEERETADGPLLALTVIIRVERDSQKGIVIGKGGSVLKRAGTDARRELEALLGVRVHLETRVRVEPDWQRRAHALDRLGL
jgi:GTPase Era involved in 16S rRNA processing